MAFRPLHNAVSVRRSMAISIAERYVGLVLTLLSFVVIARLLTPTEIGLFSIASALVGLAHVVRDFGVGSYLIQEQELTPQRLNTAFTLTAALGAVLFAATFAAAPWIASEYAQPQLTAMLRVLAFNFLLIPLGSTSLAILRREMRFNALFAVNMSSCVIGFAVTIALGYLGHGAMSLVWSSLATTAVMAALAWYLQPHAEPLRLELGQWRHVIGFGSRLTAAGIITEVAMNVNDLVVGRVMGPAPVALLSRAQGVMNVMHRDLLGAVTNVTFSAYALARREGRDVVDSFRHGLAVVSVVAWPFYGLLALFPSETLRLLFGPQWNDAARLVPVFCLAGAAAVFWKLLPSLIQAMGRADLSLRAELTIQPPRAVLLIAAIVAFRSLEAFAWTFALIYVASIPVFARNARLAVGRPLGLLTRDVARSAVVTLASLSVAAALALMQSFGLLPMNSLPVFFAAAASAVPLWIAAARVYTHPVSHEPIFASVLGRASALRATS